MSLVAGIDPGTSGAVAVYETTSRTIISMEDIPTWHEAVGKRKRKRIDTIALMELFEGLAVLGVELVVLEAVGGRPRQSASAAFVFGYTVGLIYSACLYSGIMVETVPPTKWKKLMGVPGKAGGKDNDAKKEAHGSIIKRCDELFPTQRDLFRTARNAYRMDRADAAMMAKFGGDIVLSNQHNLTDIERQLAYRAADTGA